MTLRYAALNLIIQTVLQVIVVQRVLHVIVVQTVLQFIVVQTVLQVIVVQTVLQVIAVLVNYFSAVLYPFCSDVPGSRTAGSPLSLALNSGDVSQS